VAESIDGVRLANVVGQLVGNMPHPDAPDITVRDYQAHVRAAQLMKGGRIHASDVAAAVHLLKGMQMSPADFEYAWESAKPLSQRFLGRSPKPQELKKFLEATPGEIHGFYADHPHPDFPEIKAGDFARYFHAAQPIANSTVGRNPLKLEVARFAIAGYEEEDIHRHYTHKGKS
jgi:hypothetical protein